MNRPHRVEIDDREARAQARTAMACISSDALLASYYRIPLAWVTAERKRLGKRTGVTGRPPGWGSEGAPIAGGNAVFNEAAARSCLDHLKALLRYGAKHDGLPGLSADRFRELAAEHGIAA